MAYEKVYTIGSGGDYTTFAAFQTALASTNWVASNYAPVAEIIDMQSAVSITGWTGLDVTHKLKIRPAAANDHGMDFSFASKVGFQGGASILQLNNEHLEISGLYISKTSGSAAWDAAIQTYYADTVIDRLLMEDTATTRGSAFARSTANYPSPRNIHIRGFAGYAYSTPNRYGSSYNVIVEDGAALSFADTNRYETFYNSAMINITATPNATQLANMSFCASDDATQISTSTSPYTSDVVSGDFEDMTNDDYHLSATSGLIGQGENYYSIFQTDGDGYLWPNEGAWDIGWSYSSGVQVAKTVLVTNPTRHAEFQFNDDGSFEYLFDSVTYSKPNTDSFTYKVNDSRGDSNTATVNLTINADGTQQSDQTLVHTVDTDTFTWTINGWDSAVTTGTFIDGSYWAVPAAGSVATLSALTPVTYNPVEAGFPNPSTYGLVINPDARDTVSQNYQGLLPTASQPYLSTLDVRSKLPIALYDGMSVIAPTFSNEDRTALLNSQCINNYSVLTVLDAIPTASVSFRPSVYGSDKTVYETTDFDFTTLPSLATVTASGNTWAYTDIIDYFESAWVGEQVNGEFGRAFLPDAGPNNGYSANLASDTNDMILSLFGTDAFTGNKALACYAILQRGIDLYGAYKAGFVWGPDGAGQNLARLTPIIFFGALIKDTAIKAEILALKTSFPNQDNLPFQDLAQVRKIAAGSNVAIWGDHLGETGTAVENTYWDKVMQNNAHDSVLNGTPLEDDSVYKNIGDPYGYIDGPAIEPGVVYLACCSSGNYLGMVTIANMWTEFDDVFPSDDLRDYVERIAVTGILASGDDVAPPDPRDCTDTDVITGRDNATYHGTRTYYGTTWGPNASSPGTAITNTQAIAASWNGGSGTPAGRFSKRNGMTVIGYSALANYGALAAEMWPVYNGLTLPSAPTVSGFNPPDGTTTDNYIYEFFNLFSGNVRPRDFTLASGTLPPGLSIDRGFLVGLPTTTGTYSGISITGTTEGGSVTTATASITIT